MRKTNETLQKRENKRSPGRAARLAAAHGMIEGRERSINKNVNPKKDIITVSERERQVLDSVPVDHWGNLENIIHEHCDICP